MAITPANKAVFLDKDGTLVEDIPYNVDPEKIRLYDGVPEALRTLREQGFRIVVITNQPGVAYGYFEEHKLHDLKNSFGLLFNKHDVEIDGFYYCPHHAEGTVKQYSFECNCRKPMPGMILRAAEEMNIDLSRSWMVGDILNDVEAGNRAGCKTILINNGNETEWIYNKMRTPAYMVWNISEAAKKIEEEENYQALMEKRKGYEGAIERAGREF